MLCNIFDGVDFDKLKLGKNVDDVKISGVYGFVFVCVYCIVVSLFYVDKSDGEYVNVYDIISYVSDMLRRYFIYYGSDKNGFVMGNVEMIVFKSLCLLEGRDHVVKMSEWVKNHRTVLYKLKNIDTIVCGDSPLVGLSFLPFKIIGGFCLSDHFSTSCFLHIKNFRSDKRLKFIDMTDPIKSNSSPFLVDLDVFNKIVNIIIENRVW